jgi:predicted ATPase
MDQSKRRQEILFDRSAIDACTGYLRNRTDENLERLVSMAGSELQASSMVLNVVKVSDRRVLEEARAFFSFLPKVHRR